MNAQIEKIKARNEKFQLLAKGSGSITEFKELRKSETGDFRACMVLVLFQGSNRLCFLVYYRLSKGDKSSR